MEFSTRDGDPLLYLQGKYGEARRREAAGLAYDLEAARLGRGAILNLFSDAYVRLLSLVRTEFDALGVRQPAAIVLMALAEGMTALKDIERFALDRDYEFSADEKDTLMRQGLIAIEGEFVQLLPRGKDVYGQILAALKTVEDRLVVGFTPGELSEARHFLTRIGTRKEDP
jgi:hypothetical protein